MASEDLLRAFCKLFYLRFCVWSDQWKTTMLQRFYKKLERDFYMKIIVTTIPANLVISSPLFLFCPFIETKNKNQIDKSIQQESNLIDVYKIIFLHIIPVHIIVPWYRERRCLKLSLCRTIFSVPYLDCFPYAISNIWMTFSSKSYCSFQAFEFNNCIGKTLFGSLMILLWSQVLLRLNTLQNLCFLPKVRKDILEFLQRFKSFHVHDAARKQSSIFTYFNRKENTNYCKNGDIFSFSHCLLDLPKSIRK